MPLLEEKIEVEIKVVNNFNIRIDKYLTSYLDISRESITKLIKEGKVLVNDKVIKPSYLVMENDVIKVLDFKKEESTELKPLDLKLNIVYEDDYLMVIDKPSGLVVHPGAGNKDNTLVNALINYTKNLSKKSEFRPGIVHRIDKDTSGLLLIAKTDKVHEILSERFKNKEIKREYLALLCGVFPHDTALIDAPIGRDPLNRKKFCVTAKNSKRAVSHLTVVKRYEDYTLAKFVLETGRTHQIRVHAAYIGYPIFNDPVYNKEKIAGIGQFLHSHKMSFLHPITKEKLEFESPLPPYFKDFLTTLEKDK